jgi:hypothetical protein
MYNIVLKTKNFLRKGILMKSVLSILFLVGCFVFFLSTVFAEETNVNVSNDVKTDEKKEQYYFFCLTPTPDDLRLAGLYLTSADISSLAIRKNILKKLNISCAPKINDDSSIIDFLNNQRNLEEIKLSSIAISNKTMESIAKLPNIKRLKLVHTDFITWEGIYFLAQSETLPQTLEELVLTGHNMGNTASSSNYSYTISQTIDHDFDKHKGLAILSSFKKLRRLVVVGNSSFIDKKSYGIAIVKSISQISTLEDLVLPGGEIDDNMLKKYIVKMSNLRSLDLSDTNITDNGMKSLLKMTSLGHLEIRNTLVTPRGIELLRKHPSLKRIGISYGLLSKDYCKTFNEKSANAGTRLILDPFTLKRVD